MKILPIVLCCIWTSIVVQAQQNISDFRSLKSQNPIPEYLKMISNPELKFDNGNKALASNEYMIKMLLEEGSIVFNDPISNHLNTLKKELGKDLKDIEFYTVKSNVPAVFHNYKKQVFLTTGLISRLSNEAELVFFMAKGTYMLNRIPSEYEIYDFNINPNLSESYIPKLHTDDIISESLIVQNQEINKASNKKALQVLIKYNLNPQAGIDALQKLETGKFAIEDAKITVEDLAMSGITIDLEDLEDNFKEITIKESNKQYRSYHDGVSSQIKKLTALQDKESESNKVFLTNEKDFRAIKTIATFDLINHEFNLGNIKRAIYYSLLCKRSNPDNYFIHHSLTRGFYGLTAFANSKKWSKIKNKDRRIKGEYSKFNNFINTLTKEEINLLSLTMIRAIHSKFPNDPFIKEYKRSIETDIAKFTKLSDSFFQTKTEISEIKEELIEIDTFNMSRAERIRAKQKLREQAKEKVKQKEQKDTSNKYLRPAFISSLDSTELSAISQFLNGGSNLFYEPEEDEVKYAEYDDGNYINPSNKLENVLLLNSNFYRFKAKAKSLDIESSKHKSKQVNSSLGKSHELFSKQFLNPLYEGSVEIYNHKGEFVRFFSEINLFGRTIQHRISNQDIIKEISKKYAFETFAVLNVINVIGKNKSDTSVESLADFFLIFIPPFIPEVIDKKLFQHSAITVNCKIYNINDGLLIQDYFIKRALKPSKILVESEMYNLQSTLSNE
jgi:hypothetical protein